MTRKLKAHFKASWPDAELYFLRSTGVLSAMWEDGPGPELVFREFDSLMKNDPVWASLDLDTRCFTQGLTPLGEAKIVASAYFGFVHPGLTGLNAQDQFRWDTECNFWRINNDLTRVDPKVSALAEALVAATPFKDQFYAWRSDGLSRWYSNDTRELVTGLLEALNIN
jgi:hypothetical protein